MNKRDASEGERARLALVGLVAILLGGYLAVVEATSYFWGHQYSKHITHNISAKLAGLGVVLVVIGGAFITAAIIGFRVNEHDPNRKRD